ncbi:MAG: hypothetical protein ABIF10_01395 [Candidatus Woesearchaeota archaeon]
MYAKKPKDEKLAESEEDPEELLENDEIAPEEEGFLRGEQQAEEPEEEKE